MKKILILFCFSSILIFGQYTPETFNLGRETKFSKTTDQTPSSNSISDILISNNVIRLGTSRGVSFSTDGGASWTNFYNNPEFGKESISAIGLYNGIFFAGTAHSIEKDNTSLPEGSGLKFTTDGGNTWKSAPQPLDSDNDTIIMYGDNRIRALPVTVKVQNLIYDIAFTKNTIWIATFAGGLRKVNIDTLINNPDCKWERVVIPPDYLSSIKPEDTLEFCLQPVSGKFCSDNNLNHRVFSLSGVNDSTIYVGTAGGINKTTDNGKSWVKFSHQNQASPISGNFVVALGYNEFNKTIWGATWRAESNDESYGISYSSDGGASWETSLKDERVHNFGFKFNEVFAPADNGMFRSYNNGVSWYLPNTIIDSKSKIELKTDIFYSAGILNNDIYLGSNDGLAKLSEVPGTIWTGTWKVFFASQPITGKEETYAFPNPFSPLLDQLKIKYNTGNKTVNVTIRILNFNMQPVRTLIQNVDRGNPVHEIDDNGVIDYWDGKDDFGSIVPNGVYFYRIEAGDDEPLFGKIIVLQ